MRKLLRMGSFLVRKLFEGGNYLSAETNEGNTVCVYTLYFAMTRYSLLYNVVFHVRILQLRRILEIQFVLNNTVFL